MLAPTSAGLCVCTHGPSVPKPSSGAGLLHTDVQCVDTRDPATAALPLPTGAH